MKKYLLLYLVSLIQLVVLAQLPRVSSGIIRRFENFSSRYVSARNVDVWFPQGYSPTHRYAVLYMHDGQMLFDSSTTWNKQEWGVDETLATLIRQGKIRDCIVVAPWNSGAGRHADYFPQKPFEMLPAADQDSIYYAKRTSGAQIFGGQKVRSDDYLRFLVEELKPFIDSSFSTRTDQPNTFIAGSSMGGLISLYAICEYPEVFGGAACLSTHWPGILVTKANPIPAAFMRYLQKKLPAPANHKIYFDYGTATLDSLYKPYQLQADAIMRQKRYTPSQWISREFKGDDHSEAAWRRRLHIPLQFLLGNKKQ